MRSPTEIERCGSASDQPLERRSINNAWQISTTVHKRKIVLLLVSRFSLMALWDLGILLKIVIDATNFSRCTFSFFCQRLLLDRRSSLRSPGPCTVAIHQKVQVYSQLHTGDRQSPREFQKINYPIYIASATGVSRPLDNFGWLFTWTSLMLWAWASASPSIRAPLRLGVPTGG